MSFDAPNQSGHRRVEIRVTLNLASADLATGLLLQEHFPRATLVLKRNRSKSGSAERSFQLVFQLNWREDVLRFINEVLAGSS